MVSSRKLATDLDDFLQSHVDAPRPALRVTLIELLGAVGKIADYLRESSKVVQTNTSNAFGDEQLNVDVATEKLIRDALEQCPSVITASSEEDPIERKVNHQVDSQSEELYTVAFDPLDGSSIIAPNWCVGTIIGVWDGATAVGQIPREKQIAAVLGIYGPRTTAIIALRLPNQTPTCFEVAITSESIQLVRTDITLSSPPFKTRYFAPANLRSASESPQYASLINHFISNKYTLRYSGGLVPDVAHSLVKGHGIYISPVTDRSPAKLRRLFELCPLAMIIECAGGQAVGSEDSKDILGRVIRDTDERGGIICGNEEEVDFVIKHLLGSTA